MNLPNIKLVIKESGIIPISTQWTPAQREATARRLIVIALRRYWPVEQRVRAKRLAVQWRASA